MIAHINDSKEIETVMEHCTRTANLGATLGENCKLKYLATLSGYLHDMGKYSMEFAKYITIVTGESATWDKKKLNHSSAGGKFLEEMYGNSGSTMEKLVVQIAAWSIFSHHGINNMVTVEKNNYYTIRLYPQDEIYYEETKYNFLKENKLALDKIIKYAADELNNKISIIKKYSKYKEDMEFQLGLVARLNLSILVESDRTATARFMSGKTIPYKNGTVELWNRLEVQLNSYLQMFDNNTALSKLRKKISEECASQASVMTGIYTLEVPTGGGKTLAGMRFAIKHAAKYEKNRIFYIAPFKSILEQNAQVYKDIFGGENILEYHSDIITEEDETINFYTENFQVPIVLTTMVQFLNSFFSGKMHSIRRMNAFTNAVIIFDEVQAIPIHMIHLVNGCLNFLKECCNTTILICSATQPLLNETRRPLRIDGAIVQIDEETNLKFKRNKVIDKTKDITTCSEIACLIKELLKDENSGIVICNTKQAAEQIYCEIEKENMEELHLYYMSTKMCPAHRKRILADFKQTLIQSKNSHNQKSICVSTQLLEAGVDISADFVIRTLAGLDSVTQAAGRCNRNAEKIDGNVYIVRCEEEKLNHLKSIREERMKAIRVLDEFSRTPELYKNDLLSKETMDLYYRYHFKEQENMMDYEIKSIDTSIFKLLSDYGVGSEACDSLFLHQAFKEAGKRFKAIDESTRGVIVPFEEGQNIITSLNNHIDVCEKMELLKKAQPYTINIFDAKFLDLCKQGIIKKLFSCDAFYLVEEYFDDKLGIVEETELNDLIY